MSYLFFDTETTGLPKKFNAPISDLDNWPRMVQIAWILSDDFGNIISQEEYIIKPKDFVIPLESSAIHGIDNLRANREGKDLKDVLDVFNYALNFSQPDLVAHNIIFDKNIVAAEFLRANILSNFLDLNFICTMKGSVDFCALPNKKFPKLSDLYFKLFGEYFKNAHNALDDVIACYKSFFELKKRGVL
jgi:DNA polymerase III epsilon subunit-like protein